MHKESTDEQNNPDSALFVNNQFSIAYDEYTFPSTASSSNNNSSELCYALEVPAETLNLPDDQMIALNNTYTYYNTIDEVIIEEVFEPRSQWKSPSLLSQLDLSRYSDNDELVIETPVSADDTFNACSHDVVFSTFSDPNYIQAGSLLLQTPNATIPDTQKVIDYSDTEFKAGEPKIKRKTMPGEERDWAEEINKKNRENGKEYLGKKKIEGNWKKDIKRPNRIMKPRCLCKKRKE